MNSSCAGINIAFSSGYLPLSKINPSSLTVAVTAVTPVAQDLACGVEVAEEHSLATKSHAKTSRLN